MKSFTFILMLSLAAISLQRAGFPRGPAPHFNGEAVIDNKIVKLDSKNYKGKYLILLFYPFDFTFVCPTELTAFSEKASEFSSLNANIIGLSVDSAFSHLAWTRTKRDQGGVGQLNFPLFSDITKDVSRSYGVLVEDKEDELNGASLRGLFIIDEKGIIRHVQINDAPVGRSVDEVLRLVRAFQYTDKHGEVCPANWQEGSKTIKPNPDDKLDYFKATFTGDVLN